jgi:hypothetical protein
MKARFVLILTLQTFNLVPGENTIPAEFHYEPDNANDTVAQSFLSEFIQTSNTLSLFISGDESSSPFPSLVQALEGVSLSTRLNGTSDIPLSILQTERTPFEGLNSPPIITHINVHIPPSALVDNFVFIDFDVSLREYHGTMPQADMMVVYLLDCKPTRYRYAHSIRTGRCGC